MFEELDPLMSGFEKLLPDKKSMVGPNGFEPSTSSVSTYHA